MGRYTNQGICALFYTMERKKPNRSNIILLIVLVLMIIPQTRTPIQVAFNKILAQFSPSAIHEEQQTQIESYNWTLYDEAGNVYKFGDSKGKVVLINFWATWCPPCIAEMESLQKLYDDYGESVDFLFVTADDREAVTSFKQKRQYDLPVFYDRSAPPSEISARSLPTTYLLSKQGKIVIDKKGAANWNSEKVRETIDALLAGL